MAIDEIVVVAHSRGEQMKHCTFFCCRT